MPLRPFPSPLRVGTDICRISRIHNILRRQVDEADDPLKNLNSFLRRFLGPRERIYFVRRFSRPWEVHDEENALFNRRSIQYLAGRWAAKEACIKAVKPRKLLPQEIEVWPDKNGETYAIIFDSNSGFSSKAALKEAVISSMGSFFESNLRPLLQTQEKDSTDFETHEDLQEQLPIERSANNVPSHDGINGQIARVSITHDGDYACAVALVASDPGMDDVGSEAAARRPSGE